MRIYDSRRRWRALAVFLLAAFVVFRHHALLAESDASRRAASDADRSRPLALRKTAVAPVSATTSALIVACVDDRGESVEGAEVLVESAGDGARREGATDLSGRIRFELPLGAYEASVRAAGHQPPLARSLRLSASATTAASFTLVRESGLEGRLVGADGGEVLVICRRPAATVSRRVAIDPGRRFFVRLEPGAVDVSIATATGSTGPQRLALEPGEVAEATFVLEKTTR